MTRLLSFLDPVLSLFRKKKERGGAVAFKAVPRVFPILDIRMNKLAPEWSQEDEELHVWSLSAEDGRLKIYRDYSQRAKSVVEVHIDDNVIDLRGVYRQGNFYHPKWIYAHRAAYSWLDRHKCDQLQKYQSGFWVLDWDVKKTKSP